MLISGFVDGKLIYIIEFPFKTDSFVQKLKTQLEKRFPNGDKKGEYLRSASFHYQHYIESNIRIIYLLSKDKLSTYKKNIVKNFYLFLNDNAN